ncbi:MAG: hypothetical protein IKB34_04610, partial [Clostridia bacterium]|nr:hypothetical protein [Clostridia bacterium]
MKKRRDDLGITDIPLRLRRKMMNTDNSVSEIGTEKKLRVLQVAKWCSPYIGGIERVVEDIAEGVKERVDMTILVCSDTRKTQIETRPDGTTVVRAGKVLKLFSMPISLK